MKIKIKMNVNMYEKLENILEKLSLLLNCMFIIVDKNNNLIMKIDGLKF